MRNTFTHNAIVSELSVQTVLSMKRRYERGLLTNKGRSVSISLQHLALVETLGEVF